MTNKVQKNSSDTNGAKNKVNLIRTDSSTNKPMGAIEKGDIDSDFFICKTNKGGYRNIVNDSTGQYQDGLYFYALKDDNTYSRTPTDWVTYNPIKVVDSFSSIDNTGQGKDISFISNNGRKVSYRLMMKKLANPKDVIGELLDIGMEINGNNPNNNHLINFLKFVKAGKWITTTSKTGWISLDKENYYVLPNKTYGADKNPISFIGDDVYTEYIGKMGTLANWQKFISKPLGKASSRVVLAICTALASPLIKIQGNDPAIGIHFMGRSTGGKTTVLKIARSTLGSSERIQTWNSTIGGLDLLATSHNDLPLILDELSSAGIAKKQIPDVIYRLMEGGGRAKMKADSTAKKINTWRIALISSGEEGIRDIVKEYGLNTLAGRELRLIEVPSDSGSGIGVFEENPYNPVTKRPINLRAKNATHELGDYVTVQLKANYGCALPAFIDCIVNIVNHEKGEQSLKTYLKEKTDKFIQEVVVEEESPQIKRVAGYYGFIYAVGLLASGAEGIINSKILKSLGYEKVNNITGWEENLVFEAIKKCYLDWRADFGSGNDREYEELITRIGLFVSKNLINFSPVEGDTRPYGIHVGWREYTESEMIIYLDASIFESEITNKNALKKMLVTKGVLHAYGGKKFPYQNRKTLTMPIKGGVFDRRCRRVYEIHWRDVVKEKDSEKESQQELYSSTNTGEFLA